MTHDAPVQQTVAVTGATGYIGGRLVPALLEAGYKVRCIVREPRKLDERTWRYHPSVTVECSNLSDSALLAQQLSGCNVAFYLVHSMQASGAEYAEHDRMLADVFAKAAAAARVERIIYLGGLGEMGKGLSQHLSSRREVEQVLAWTGVPVTSFRAAMIIGSGSASFEILRYLVERLPIMVTPSWVKTESQPVAVADVLHWLVRCLKVPETAGKALEIGGGDVLPYRELMRIMAEELKIPPRVIIALPLLTPRLSSGWISLVTPVSYRIARPLADGLRNRVVVTNDEVQRLMPHEPMSARDAIRKALARVNTNNVETRWSVAGPIAGDPNWAGGTVFSDARSIIIAADGKNVFQAVCRIGGGHGWYAGDLLWQIRGWMDKVVGGPGLRRGRRHPDRVEFGESLDFWRVIGLERDRSLSLLAEMKLPGIATLSFSIEPPKSDGKARLTMVARFRPKGILGIAYWYSVLPLHNIVFGGMLRGIKRTAEASSAGTTLTPRASIISKSGYGRARLWLGISAVGTIVSAAVAALTLDLPAKAASGFDSSLGGQLLTLIAFLAIYAVLQAPFDLFGGYVLPRRFGRVHPPFLKFVGTLIRGIAVHSTMLALVGVCLLFAGRSFGAAGAIVAAISLSIVLLFARGPLSRLVARLKHAKIKPTLQDSPDASIPFDCVTSDDEGFTGGFIGVSRPRRVIMPEHWLGVLGQRGFAIMLRRRQAAVQSGSWLRGRALAVAFTWSGVAAAALIVGSDRLGTAAGIIELSLIFTLWSFVGLLILPTLSRAGVAEIDAVLRRTELDATLLDETVQRLDQLQDAETERPSGVEMIFHPVPSVKNRIEGPTTHHARGFLDAARSTIFLSASGLGLLGRSVHCNCGRPALWVFLPSD